MTVAALFNDRTATAWLIVAAYFAGALASFWAQRGAPRRERQFWLGAAILLILLGLNKELDLQALMTENARDLARHAGWYEQRRLMQGIFLLLLSISGIAALAALAVWLRRSSWSVKAAAAGIVLLFAFIVIRAASVHHIDDWVTVDVEGLRSGWWLELAGIAVIGVSALVYRAGSRAKLDPGE